MPAVTAMPKITIREHQRAAQPTDESFAAKVIFDDKTQYDITVRDPFDAKQERALEFYFEEWIQFPFDEQVRAQRAAASVKEYGERLFEDVFGGRQAYRDYSLACEGGLSGLRIEIEGDSPAFQALHWEALKDPELPRPLAVECVFTRKRFRQGGLRIRPRPSSEINLLVVTARPDEESDVGYRTISRPLIEAIERGRVPVNVELLRPGTFEALSEHLERKEGFYHIVHFDAHGGLMTHQQYQAGAKADRYVFRSRRRLGLEPYEGEKSFLFFEGAEKGQADPVEAGELADLLVDKGIPICVLNACQSGKQVSDLLPDGEMRETSLGSRLMSAGVQTVVAMGYSVTVSAAALMMEKLYGSLFEQSGVPEAIRLGRKELHEDKFRRVYFNQEVALEDWLLPVVYANGEVDLQLELLRGEARAAYLTARGQRYRFEEPTYGFVGRDLDILKIEKALLKHNVLLLQGMGGTGKTTLLNYLRQWWQTTGFVRDVFYFGYDEGAHTLEQMLRVIGKRLCKHRHEFNEFESVPLAAQMVDVADKLRAQPYGLVLDNLESVTGEALAIPNTLPEEEREKIKDFLKLLKGGRTKVLLGARSAEDWLADVFSAFGKVNRIVLGGLDPESRTVLAERILDAQVGDARRIAKIRRDEGFKRLMKLLAGYPLAMEVVLANLARQSPQEVLKALDAAEVDLSYVGGEDRTNNILKCVEYSHSNLSADAQKLLVCLAPFSGFVFRGALEGYGEQLQKLEPFQEYDFERFDEAVKEAIQWGLLSPMKSDDSELLTIQPIFPYFLRTKLQKMNLIIQDRIYEGFSKHYRELAKKYQQYMESQIPSNRNIGLNICRLEYENLYNALQVCLERQDPVDILFCLTDYCGLRKDSQMKLQLLQDACDKLEHYPKSFLAGESGHQMALAVERKAEGYLKFRQYKQAVKAFKEAIDSYSKLSDEELKRAGMTRAYKHLGIMTQDLKDYEQAHAYFQQVLDIEIEYNNRYNQAGTYLLLGNLSQELRNYEHALTHYQQALDIFIEHDDRDSQAGIYFNLGMVMEELEEYKKAAAYYKQAFDIFTEYNDGYSQARVAHQLGCVAIALGDYEDARSLYRVALDIKIRCNNRYDQATTYHQLGIVAETLGEYKQARSHYQQALDICIEYNDRYSQARTYGQLGLLTEDQEDYAQAQQHLQQALAIFFEFNDQHSVGMTIGNLFRLYQTTQDNNILTSIAQCLNSTVEEVTQLFEQFDSKESE